MPPQGSPLPRNDGQHGWSPSRGIPPAARSTKDKVDSHGFTKAATGERPTRKQPASPRSGGNAGATRVRGGVEVPSKRDGMQSTRTQRHTRGGTWEKLWRLQNASADKSVFFASAAPSQHASQRRPAKASSSVVYVHPHAHIS